MQKSRRDSWVGVLAISGRRVRGIVSLIRVESCNESGFVRVAKWPLSVLATRCKQSPLPNVSVVTLQCVLWVLSQRTKD